MPIVQRLKKPVTNTIFFAPLLTFRISLISTLYGKKTFMTLNNDQIKTLMALPASKKTLKQRLMAVAKSKSKKRKRTYRKRKKRGGRTRKRRRRKRR